jgi:predicted lipoprotein with Yx(FWY)xxD motif
VMQKDGIGSYLTDSKGMTLYYFAKDEPGKSACTGDCLTKWPLFKGESVSVADGLDVKSFGVLVRTEGNQATFIGYPLYYFFKDEKTGDTNGQGVNNAWYVIDPAKFPPAK